MQSHKKVFQCDLTRKNKQNHEDRGHGQEGSFFGPNKSSMIFAIDENTNEKHQPLDKFDNA